MKIDIDLEELENGWVLTLNGKRYACDSPIKIQRKIMNLLMEGKTQKEHYAVVSSALKDFWKDKIGVLQKQILEIVERDKYSTLEDLTAELKGNYKFEMWEVRGRIKNILMKLVKKGYLKRPSAQSKKYYLTDKRPEAYVQTGKVKVE